MKHSSPSGALASSSDALWHALRDGTPVLIRPIRASDVELERRFIERLSPRSRRFRFLGSISKPSPELLKQLTQPELKGGIAYVALAGTEPDTQLIGVCRYATSEQRGVCECAVAVSDEWQGKGLATTLMERLIESARSNGFKRMFSIDAAGNQDMRELAAHLGFTCAADPDDPTLVIHTLQLQPPDRGASAA